MTVARKICTSGYATLQRAVLTLLCMAMVIACGAPRRVEIVNDEHGFWPSYPNEPRIQFLTSYEFMTGVDPKHSGLEQFIVGEAEDDRVSITKPYGVAVSRDKIYVCDMGKPGVAVLDLQEQGASWLGTSGYLKLRRPTGIAIASDGTVYVADIGHNLIFVFTASGELVRTFGQQPFTPGAIAVHGPNLYVCDFADQRVEIIDRETGESKTVIGERGHDYGQFIRPLGIDVDSLGHVYVTDVLACRVQKFSGDGKLMLAFGEMGDGPGDLVRPKHLAVDAQGRIYVVDASFQNVQIFNEYGEVLTYFGGPGNHAGAMLLPAGICITDQNLERFSQYAHPAFRIERLLIVTNQFGPHKVAVYAFGGLRPDRTVEDLISAEGARSRLNGRIRPK